jgi:hypothetical protein
MKTKNLILMAVLMALPLVMLAAPPNNNNNIPLDPVSWVLLAAGAGVASKKYYDKRKEDKNSDTEV